MHLHPSTPRHCQRCGGELHLERVKAGEPERLVCAGCRAVTYLDPKLAACALLVQDGQVLLCRREIEPAKGRWVLPGGFVDRGEVVARACEREVREETGLIIAAGPLLGLYSYPGEHVAVAVYLGRINSGRAQAGDETSEVGWFDLKDLPWGELAFASTADALRDYLEKKTC